MKKSLYLLLTASILIFSVTISACNTKSTDTTSTSDTASAESTEESAININELQDEYDNLKTDYDSIIKIYDETLESSIYTYCEMYLSYNGSATDNIEKIKAVITDSFYNELSSQTGYQQSLADYEQSTGLYKLYYENNSSPSDNIEVIGLCKQTVIFDGEVNITDTAYVFGMQYTDNIWKINSVDTVITNTN